MPIDSKRLANMAGAVKPPQGKRFGLASKKKPVLPEPAEQEDAYSEEEEADDDPVEGEDIEEDEGIFDEEDEVDEQEDE